jgi:hypothetical protein
MIHIPARTGSALVLLGLASACSPNADEEANPGSNAPMVAVPSGPTLCADGEACGADPDRNDDPTNVTTTGDGTPVFGEEVSNGGGIRLSDKIDLLFVVDNSVSMGDKQQIFSAAIPDLLERLVNPPCLNAALTETVQPATAEEPCPVGFGRQFAPVKDIHVGIVTSSLGAHGADDPIAGCTDPESDRAYMIGALERGRVVPSYRDLGFLSWDPEQRVQPPGATNLDELAQGFVQMLDTVGESGCGFEAPLEAMYRFLMDPAPHATLERVACNTSDPGENCVRRGGLDQALLDQRNAFLRPDSVVAIVMLADEDDCSIRDTDIAWWQADQSRGITRASAACDSDPNSACCYSCSFETPAGCTAKEQDTGCCPPGTDGAACTGVEPLISPEEERSRLGQNLRCFDQKRKYGYDYLYPIQRYVLGLTSPWLPEGFDEQGRPLTDADGNVRFLKNPLFSQPLDDEGNVRAKEQVFFVGIVGVPWQDVATDETRDVPGQLDLIPASDFAEKRLWERILGSKETGVLPEDPFARESTLPRAGVNPLTNDAIMPPDSTVLNAINGKERAVFDDLQYACIFPLPVSRSCAAGSPNAGAACDCREDRFEGNPLCWDAATAAYGTEQRFAKAYPAPRILSVLQGVGEQAVVASICPKNMTDTTGRDYGYRPVIGTFVKEAARILIK